MLDIGPEADPPMGTIFGTGGMLALSDHGAGYIVLALSWCMLALHALPNRRPRVVARQGA